jgi:hypothetical protein
MLFAPVQGIGRDTEAQRVQSVDACNEILEQGGLISESSTMTTESFIGPDKSKKTAKLPCCTTNIDGGF